MTGPEREIQPQIGRDIVKFVARPAGIGLDVVVTTGPAESLQHMQIASGASLALLQSDTAYAYADAAARGISDAGRLLVPVRVIASLYEEDIYFITRSDSAFNVLQDIRDARINIGPLKSGAALSATSIYRLLFGVPIPDHKVSFYGHEEALVKLITDLTVDVVVFVAAQPAKLLANMKPEARRFIKVLKFDASQAGSEAILQIYGASTVRAASYPNLLSEDIPSIATRVYLVAYGQRRDEDANLARFSRAWCKYIPRMQAEGHSKWREIEPALSDLKPGWNYAKPVVQELTRCTGKVPPAVVCSQQERVLGLCE